MRSAAAPRQSIGLLHRATKQPGSSTVTQARPLAPCPSPGDRQRRAGGAAAATRSDTAGTAAGAADRCQRGRGRQPAQENGAVVAVLEAALGGWAAQPAAAAASAWAGPRWQGGAAPCGHVVCCCAGPCPAWRSMPKGFCYHALGAGLVHAMLAFLRRLGRAQWSSGLLPLCKPKFSQPAPEHRSLSSAGTLAHRSCKLFPNGMPLVQVPP
jgi:hypothetical protein